MSGRLRDWLTSPSEWGEWGSKANHWFNELVADLREAEADIDTNASDIATNTSDIATNASNITSLASSASPTLASGWSNFGSGDAFCEVRKTRDGFCTLQGRISNTSGAAKATNSTITTLDSTYRPTRQHLFTQYCSTGSLQYLLVVRSTGVVSMVNAGAAAGSLPAAGNISIDCHWHVDG